VIIAAATGSGAYTEFFVGAAIQTIGIPVEEDDTRNRDAIHAPARYAWAVDSATVAEVFHPLQEALRAGSQGADAEEVMSTAM
jgi:hypothetical protein